MGRIASSLVNVKAPNAFESWGGFVYDATGRVSVLRERAKDISGLSGHESTEAMGQAVESAADGVGALRWQYEREVIGSLLQIQETSQGIVAPRFSADPVLRSPNGSPTARLGHRLWKFDVNGGGRSATHDAAGRVRSDGEQNFNFDDFDLLTTVKDRYNNLREGYLYSADNKLVARFDQTAVIVEELVYDGVQMVESFGENGQLNWSAAWGPGIDNLLSLTTSTQEYFTLSDGRANVVGATPTSARRWSSPPSTRLRGAESTRMCRTGARAKRQAPRTARSRSTCRSASTRRTRQRRPASSTSATAGTRLRLRNG